MKSARKLTPAQKRILDYALDHGEVAMWPMRLSMVRRCEANGWLETCGREPGVMGFVKRRLTEAGKEMLGASS